MTILANLPARIPFVAVVVASCSSPVTEPAPSTLPAPALVPAPIAIDASPGISEVQARHTLDGMFRDAGFRILNDEPFERGLIEVVLDGYDPEQGVGYEYVDALEIGADLSPDERVALAEHGRIFVIGNCSLDTLADQAAAFLDSVVLAADAGPTP